MALEARRCSVSHVDVATVYFRDDVQLTEASYSVCIILVCDFLSASLA